MSDDSQQAANTQPANAAPEKAWSFWPDLSLLGVVTIWGINIPVVKVGLDRTDAFVFQAMRLILSAIVLWSMAKREGGPSAFTQRELPRRFVWLYAFLASGIYQLMFLLGVKNTTSGNAALILSTMPMWTALLANVFLKERLSKLAWAGLLTAFTGTIVVTLEKGNLSANAEHLTGNIFMLCAALAWSGGTVSSRRVLTHISPLQLSAFASITMLPLHMLIAVPNLSESLPTLTDYHVWLPIIYSGIFSTGMALAMWNFGVRHAGAAHAAVFQNLVPVIAMTAAWLIRSEPASSSQIAGGVLIISGLLIMRRGRR